MGGSKRDWSTTVPSLPSPQPTSQLALKIWVIYVMIALLTAVLAVVATNVFAGSMVKEVTGVSDEISVTTASSGRVIIGLPDAPRVRGLTPQALVCANQDQAMVTAKLGPGLVFQDDTLLLTSLPPGGSIEGTTNQIEADTNQGVVTLSLASRIAQPGLTPNSLVATDADHQLTTVALGTGLTLSGSTLNVNATAGVSSVSGTTNEITAATSAGVVTLSLPSAVTVTTLNATTVNATTLNATTLTMNHLVYADGSQNLAPVTLGTGLTFDTLTSTLEVDSSAVVLAVGGTTNEIIAATSAGVVTLSLPSAVTVTTLNATTLNVSTLTENQLVYANGSRNLTAVTLGAGLTLTGEILSPTVASITGTINQITTSLDAGLVTLALPTVVHLDTLNLSTVTGSSLVMADGDQNLTAVTLGAGLTLTGAILSAPGGGSGVSEVRGTLNEIMADTTTGVVTLSLPNPVYLGNIKVSGVAALSLLRTNTNNLLSDVSVGAGLLFDGNALLATTSVNSIAGSAGQIAISNTDGAVILSLPPTVNLGTLNATTVSSNSVSVTTTLTALTANLTTVTATNVTVTSLAAQLQLVGANTSKGLIGITVGSGLTLSGTQLQVNSSALVTAINGFTNQVAVSGNTGAVIISLTPTVVVSTALGVGGVTPANSFPCELYNSAAAADGVFRPILRLRANYGNAGTGSYLSFSTNHTTPIEMGRISSELQTINSSGMYFYTGNGGTPTLALVLDYDGNVVLPSVPQNKLLCVTGTKTLSPVTISSNLSFVVNNSVSPPVSTLDLANSIDTGRVFANGTGLTLGLPPLEAQNTETATTNGSLVLRLRAAYNQTMAGSGAYISFNIDGGSAEVSRISSENIVDSAVRNVDLCFRTFINTVLVEVMRVGPSGCRVANLPTGFLVCTNGGTGYLQGADVSAPLSFNASTTTLSVDTSGFISAVTGTTNQISVTSSSTTRTLLLPDDLRTPGTLCVNGAVPNSDAAFDALNGAAASTSGTIVARLRALYTTGTLGSGSRLVFSNNATPPQTYSSLASAVEGSGAVALVFSTTLSNTLTEVMRLTSTGTLRLPVYAGSSLLCLNSSKDLTPVTISSPLTFSGTTLGVTFPLTEVNGTANQIIATLTGTVVLLTLPQNIATSSTVQFGGVTVSTANTFTETLTSSGINGNYIQFVKTSGTTRSWALGATGASSFAGDNQFALVDETAGSNKFRVLVSSTGQFGIGPTTPVYELDVLSGANATARVGGWAAVSCDTDRCAMFGNNYYRTLFSANAYATINTSTTSGYSGMTCRNGEITFQTFAGATTAGQNVIPTDYVKIDSSGNMTVQGTDFSTTAGSYPLCMNMRNLAPATTLGYQLNFRADSNIIYSAIVFNKDVTDKGDTAIWGRATISGSSALRPRLSVLGSGEVTLNGYADGTSFTGNVYALSVDGTGKVLRASSSLRYKYDVTNLFNSQNHARDIFAVAPRRFRMRNSDEYDIGLIAEELHEAGVIDLVLYDSYGRPEAVKYDRVSLYLLDVVKQQDEEVVALQTQVTDLQSQLLALSARLAAAGIP